jgi:glutathione synthase/RimK-type ligase-like ATP-grasp enzyme
MSTIEKNLIPWHSNSTSDSIMYQIALLTYQDFPLLIDADRKLLPELFSLGIVAEAVIWDDDDVNFKKYDALIFRNTWDYFTKQDVFFAWLQNLEKQGITTFNPLQVIKKNSHKFYLQEMEKLGVKIIPSIFLPKSENLDLSKHIPVEWKKMVIKPAISAGSHLTTLFDRTEIGTIAEKYNEISQNNDLILQNFIPEILTQGEISMVFFDKKFSHAVVKTPKKGDFRIQSQFGGQYRAYLPSDEMKNTAAGILAIVEDDLLYARVDGVLINNEFHLMEMELIEPDLYMDYLPDGQKTFGKVIKEFLDRKL